jgi:hypothetical protein
VCVDDHAPRRLAGLVQARRLGRADVDPGQQLAGQVAHGERRFVGIGEAS